jgi:hypothetical protein
MSKDKISITYSSDGFFANSAAIVTEVFKSPTSSSVVITGAGYTEPPKPVEPPPAPTLPPEQGRKIPIQPTFKLVFLTVLGLTVVAFIAQVVMAAIWDKPTPNQQAVFEAAAFAWKAGIGAIFGLLGGKQI